MMIPTRILFTPPNIKMIGVIPIEVFEKETYTRSSKISEYPIEDGSVISDHIVNSPRIIEADCVVGVGLPASPDKLLTGINFADIFYAINFLIDAKVLTTIVMGLAVYTNMHIESFIVNRDRLSSHGLVFNFQAKEGVIVKSQLLTIPNSNISTTQQQGFVNMGNVNSGQSSFVDQFSRGQAYERDILIKANQYIGASR